MCESKQPEITGLFSNEVARETNLPPKPIMEEEIAPQKSELQPMLTGLLEQLVRASILPALEIPEKDDMYPRRGD